MPWEPPQLTPNNPDKPHDAALYVFRHLLDAPKTPALQVTIGIELVREMRRSLERAIELLEFDARMEAPKPENPAPSRN